MPDRRRSSPAWLRLNGCFLAVMGSGAALADIVSYRSGIGPWGPLFRGDPLVITAFEAHALAAILGVLMVVHARSADARWHLTAAAIELTLGAANLAWFDVFRRTDTVPMGIGVTCVHVLLLGAQSWAWVRSRARDA